MIRKKAALFFTLLANIVLLAMAVVPHHHHANDICGINTICHSDHEEEKDHDGDQNHDHNNEGGNHFCLLKQEIVLPSNNLEHLLAAPESVDFQNIFGGFFTPQNNFEAFRFVPPEHSRVQFAFKSDHYSCYESIRIALRGPPTV